MKKILVGMIALTTAIGSMSCGSPKKATASVEKTATEITLPFSDSKYRSDKDNFRAKNLGKSPDLATAKKISLQNAKSEIAGNIQALVKRVTSQYTNQRTVGTNQDFENKFEEQANEVVSQSLRDVRILDEKVFKEVDGSFTYWTAIEIPKQSLLEGINSKISNNAKLKLDYDQNKFKETFDKEMEKLEKEGK